MRTLLIQSPIIWENPNANRLYFGEIITNASDVDLIILPEMFSTGFTMNPLLNAERMDGETVVWLKGLAKSKNAAITGSVVIVEDGQYYNRLLFVFPNGEISHYDKRHLFTLAREDKVYKAGTQKLIVNYRGWKICPMVCYDLRFPVFSRNVEDYDLLLFVANWPESRIDAWDALLKARAIENMSFVIGSNRIGKDGNNHNYNGHSQILDCLGKYILKPSENEFSTIITLDKSDLQNTRSKFGFLDDRDSFTVN